MDMDTEIDYSKWKLPYDFFGVNRKDQHVGLAAQLFEPEPARDFAETRFVHQSLPQLKIDDVDISTQIAGIDCSVPFYINAMTGGSEKTQAINQLIGIMACITKIPVASGSVSAALKDPSVARSFTVLRSENPKGVLFANLGAHHDVENAKRAVDLLEANTLQLHLNAPQEIVMPEGDRDFTSWMRNIETIVREIEVPVIVKEVGFGMSRDTIKQLASIGVKTVDVSGAGGTDFVAIENDRRVIDDYTFLTGWGQTTVISLMEAMSVSDDIRPQILASGGVKSALDIVKSLSLGADAVGMSNYFLKKFQDRMHMDNTLGELQSFKDYIREVMTILGARNIAELRQKDIVVGPAVQNWCDARGIEWKHYANRTLK